MKLIGTILKKGNLWILQIPPIVVKLAEINGLKIADKVRLKIRIIKDNGYKDIEVKTYQTYYTKLLNLQLVIPQTIIQELDLKDRMEIIFEPIEE